MLAACKWKSVAASYSNFSGLDKLDAYFCQVLDFTSLKQCTRFFAIKQ